MEREKRKAARAHLDQRVPNNPVPPSDPKYDPLYHVATTNTWVEIPDVAKQQFTNIMRELLAQFSNIPLEQRCSSRATDVISKIQLLPSEVLAKSSSRMNAKAVRKLKRGMFAFARNASSEEKIELEARREREAVAAAGVAAIACALREVPDEKHGDEPALEIAMHSPTQAAFSPGSPPRGSQARAPQLFVADSVADEGSVSDAHAEEAGEHAKVDVPAAASGSDASAEEEECESEADAEAVERAVRSLAFRIVRAQQLYLRGYTRKATNLLLSTPPIILNPQVIQKLFDLHPEPSSRDRPPIPEDAPNVAVDPDLLVKIVRRAANGSSRDASGWTAELLVVLLDDEECMAGLTDLIQDILNNNLNEDSRQLILLSKLIALQKANDPSTPRPIAIGGVLYKIAALYALELIRHQLLPIFDDIQLGIGAPGGAARAVHALQAAFDFRGKGATGVFFDQKNAFNSASRSNMLLAVFSEASLAPIWKFVEFGYGGPSLLVLVQKGEIVASILSQDGSRQGDPLGSLLYCLFLMPKIRDITSVCDQGSHSEFAIVDDLSVVTDEWEQAVGAFDKANEVLQLNKHKTKFLWPHDSPPPAGLVQACRDRGVELLLGTAEVLGAIVGTGDSDFEDFAIHKVESYMPLMDILKSSEFRAQIAVGILRSAMNNKLGYLMRALAPRHTRVACQMFDAHVQDTFCRIHRIDSIKEGAEEGFLCLPKSLGGINIAKSTDLNTAAYFSQAVSAAPHIKAPSNMCDDNEAIPAFIADREAAYRYLVDVHHIPTCSSLLNEEGDLAPGAILPTQGLLRNLAEFYNGVDTKRFRLQSLISRRIAKARLQCILDSADSEVVAGFLSRMSKDASNWAFLTPKTHHTSLSNSDWIQTIKFHLNRLPDDLVLKCACGKALSSSDPSSATHYRSCTLYKRRAVNVAHDDISSLCAEHAKQIGLTAGFSKRPRGLKKNVTTDGWYIDVQGKRIDWDVTVSHLPATSYLKDARKPGLITDRKEKSKLRKHLQACRIRGVDFVPFALETHGGIGNSARSHIEALCQQALAVPYNNVEDGGVIKLKRRMLNELSVVIQRGNAKVMRQGAADSRSKGPTFYNFQGRPNTAFPKINLRSNESSLKARLSTMNIRLAAPQPVSSAELESETDYEGDTECVFESEPELPSYSPNNRNSRSEAISHLGLDLSNLRFSPFSPQQSASAPLSPYSSLPSDATSDTDRSSLSDAPRTLPTPRARPAPTAPSAALQLLLVHLLPRRPAPPAPPFPHVLPATKTALLSSLDTPARPTTPPPSQCPALGHACFLTKVVSPTLLQVLRLHAPL